MPLEEPHWWYDKRNSTLARALKPLSLIYGHVSQRRMLRPPGKIASLPVICVGNFTAGGTGKTPLVIAIAEMVRRMGGRPVFLSRGHGGRLKGPHLVLTEADNARDVGDEPLLLANHAPVVIARDRAAGAGLIERNRLGTMIIMDDGLQNPGLHKDLAIAVVDGDRGIGNAHTIPAGPLRAPLAAQLAITDAILIYGTASAELVKTLQNVQLPILNARVMPVGDLEWISAKPLLAFAGIGNPQRFFALLERLGGKIVDIRRFPDHYAYSMHDAQDLLYRAQQLGAQLVTTEKDLVRFDPQISEAHRQMRADCLVLPIRTQFMGSDETALEALIARLECDQ